MTHGLADIHKRRYVLEPSRSEAMPSIAKLVKIFIVYYFLVE
jgi:hypothetical protein